MFHKVNNNYNLYLQVEDVNNHMTMGNAIKACLGRCHDNIAGNEFSSDDLRTNWFMSEGNLSYDSSIYSQSTLNEPSVLSFKMIGRNSCVYLDGDVCKICLEEYDDEQRKPYILPCGHTFCVLCLRTLSKRRRFKSIRCPIDRETLYISSRHSKGSVSLS